MEPSPQSNKEDRMRTEQQTSLCVTKETRELVRAVKAVTGQRNYQVVESAVRLLAANLGVDAPVKVDTDNQPHLNFN
jgi:hypothetical protein